MPSEKPPKLSRDKRAELMMAWTVSIVVLIVAAVFVFGFNRHQEQPGAITYGINETGAFSGPFYVTNANATEYNLEVACILSPGHEIVTSTSIFHGPADAMEPFSTERFGQDQVTKKMAVTSYYNSTIPADQSLLALNRSSIQCFSPSGVQLGGLKPGKMFSGALYFNYTNSSGQVNSSNLWHTWGILIPNMTVVSNFSNITVFTKFMKT